MDNKPLCTDVSSDVRDWDDLFPDQYFQPEALIGRKLTLQIASAISEQYPGDAMPRCVLVFSNATQKLKTTKANRIALKKGFGSNPPAALGKWVEITGVVNTFKRVEIELTPLPNGPQQPQTVVAPQQQPTQQNIPPEVLAQLQAVLASQKPT